jgi:glycosyltransferase involved in cell wall biosynthesis
VLAPELRHAGIATTAFGKAGGLDVRTVRGVRSALRRQGAQVLHTHNPAAQYYGALAALALPVVVVNTRHGMGNAPFNVRREVIYRVSLARAAAVALVCASAARDFVRHRVVPRGKAKVVPNGIRLEQIPPRTAERRGRALVRLGLDPAGFYIGTVGRLSPVKDHATLLRAVAEVRAQVRETHLIVVGGGALHGELQELAATLGLKDHAHLLGDRADVPELLAAFDVFVLSSRSEGYSISLLEACASALPIVATDVGGNREIVRDGVSGTLVEPGAPAALARAILALAADHERGRAMGAAGRAWVCAEGSIQAMARRYLTLYQGTAAGA